MASRKYTRHGLRQHPLYSVWTDMRTRCANPENPYYHRYGGRGVSVCERWSTFPPFLEDMGDRPEGYTLDRIDNDGDYEPGNCRWASQQDQALNKAARQGNTGARNVHLRMDGRYECSITRRGVRHYLGSFTTLIEAVEARDRLLNNYGN